MIGYSVPKIKGSAQNYSQMPTHISPAGKGLRSMELYNTPPQVVHTSRPTFCPRIRTPMTPNSRTTTQNDKMMRAQRRESIKRAVRERGAAYHDLAKIVHGAAPLICSVLHASLDRSAEISAGFSSARKFRMTAVPMTVSRYDTRTKMKGSN